MKLEVKSKSKPTKFHNMTKPYGDGNRLAAKGHSKAMSESSKGKALKKMCK